MRLGLRHIIAAILLIVSFGAPITATAGPLEDARAAYAKGDYATALGLLGPLADQGSAKAQTILGVMNTNGQGVPQNYIEAIKWYRLAADHRRSIAAKCQFSGA
jgi:uncharacterized protein